MSRVKTNFFANLAGSGHVARIDLGITRGIWRFAAGMSGITVTALILTQLDKIILSKLLELKTFGFYVLAGVVANGISAVLITPMFNTVFPRFSALVAAKDEKGLTVMYHGSTQVMAVLILPFATVLAFFSQEVMVLWTQNAEVARNTAPIVSILVAGTALNGMMNLPYALQLAHEWTRLANTFFGAESAEARHIRRVLKNEYPLLNLLYIKSRTSASHIPGDMEYLDELVTNLYMDGELSDQFRPRLYHLAPPFLLRPAEKAYKFARKFLPLP